MHTPLPLRLLTLLLAPCLAVAQSASLLPNGSLEELDGEAPKGWPHGVGVSFLKEDNGNHFFRIESSGPTAMDQLYFRVALPPGSATAHLSFRTRHHDVTPGHESWNDARILINAIDEDETKTNLEGPRFSGSSPEWTEHSLDIPLPRDTAFLELIPCLFYATSGSLDIDDLSLTTSTPPPEELHDMTDNDTPIVQGNQLLTRDGRPLLLRGINMPSLEWRVTGEYAMESMHAAILSWKANVVRVAINPLFWFGRGAERNEWNAQDDDGAGYRAFVDSIIQFANQHGCYIVLDLHAYLAATEEHATFWKNAAARYANKPGVLFDLLNEPYDTSWDVWRNGGTILPNGKSLDPNAPTPENTIHAIGMQGLLNAVRSTGAKNAVLCGGLDWAYDLTGITQGFALDDPSGNGVIYSAHMYPWKGEWISKILVAADQFPIFIGEFGCEISPMPWETSIQNPYRWAPDALAFMEKHHFHWTAWCMHTDATPRAISDWNFTPTPFFGAFVRAALEGAHFQSNRVR